jgi:hypothetical protein
MQLTSLLITPDLREPAQARCEVAPPRRGRWRVVLGPTRVEALRKAIVLVLLIYGLSCPGLLAGQPEGELSGTRTVENSGALTAIAPQPRRTAKGNLVLEWTGVKDVLYRATVSRDAQGRQVLRRYLTPDSRVDLRGIQNFLEPGHTYFWWVETIPADGLPVVIGPRQSFIAEARQRAADRAQIAPTSPVPALPLAALIANRTPEPNSTVGDVRPALTVEFRAPLDAARLVLIVDDTDVTALLRVNGARINYTPVGNLGDGVHMVGLAFGAAAESWEFVVQRGAGGAGNASGGGSGSGKPDNGAESARAQSGAQVLARISWSRQSIPDSDANFLSFTRQTTLRDGPWRAAINGLGLLNSILPPGWDQVSADRFNDYFFQLAGGGNRWGVNLRFGLVAAELFTGSQFITMSAQEGTEAALRTPAGTFAYYGNTTEMPLGGAGAVFRRELTGASWTAPLPKRRAELRLMWLSARDAQPLSNTGVSLNGNLFTTQGPLDRVDSGDVYEGALFQMRFSPKWVWSSEFVWVHNTANSLDATARPLSSHALRTGLTGTLAGIQVSVIYRDVGRGFSSPAVALMNTSGASDRHSVQVSASRPTKKIGTFNLGYNYQASDLSRAERPSLILRNVIAGWTKNFGPKTALAIQAREMRNFSGWFPSQPMGLTLYQQKQFERDLRDRGLNANLTRTVGNVVLTLGGSRAWYRNAIVEGGNLVTTSMLVGANWNRGQFLQLNTNFGVNWATGEKSSVGATRTITASFQPMFTWRRTELSLTPIIGLNQMRTELANGAITSDQLSGQYGGRLSWNMPGAMRFSTLSCEGNFSHDRNYIWGTAFSDARLLVVWTMVWGYNRNLEPARPRAQDQPFRKL